MRGIKRITKKSPFSCSVDRVRIFLLEAASLCLLIFLKLSVSEFVAKHNNLNKRGTPCTHQYSGTG